MKLRARLGLAIALVPVPLVVGASWLRLDGDRRTAEQSLRQVVMAQMAFGGRQACEADPVAWPPAPSLPPFAAGGPPPGGPPESPFPPSLGPPDPPPFGEGPPPPPGAGRGPPPGFAPPFARGPLDGGFAPPWARRRLALFAYDGQLRSANPQALPLDGSLVAELGGGAGASASRWSRESGEPSLEIITRMPWRSGPCQVILARLVGPEADLASRFGAAVLSPLLLAGLALAGVLFAIGPVVRRLRRLTAQVEEAARERYRTTVELGGDDEVAELAWAFNDAAREIRNHLSTLEQREQSLRAFLANTTHDVMLPLTVLLGQLTLIQRRIAAAQVPDRELVGLAIEEAHYVISLIQNLGVAAKLESGELALTRHPFPLGRLVERAVERLRPIATERQIELTSAVPPDPLDLDGDELLLEQAVGNLVHNAIRYNQPGGHVAVLLEEGDDAAGFRLRVIDDGPGIPDDQRLRVLERGVRGEAGRRRSPQGLGLGLAIAREIALRHGLFLELRRSEYGGLEAEIRGPRR